MPNTLTQIRTQPRSKPYAPLQFNYVAYLLWRRKLPRLIRLLSHPLLRRYYPVDADKSPPASAEAMSRYLIDWNILSGLPGDTITRALRDSRAVIHSAHTDASPTPFEPRGRESIRIPAQWEPMQEILISWPVLHPPLWNMHAQMVEAITPVCDVTLLVTTPMWAHAIWVYLLLRERANLERLRFLVLPTNDQWIRDYGPIVGLDSQGNHVVVDAIFDPLPNYPKGQDNAMPQRWAAHHEIPILSLELHSEGGNIWSDSAGTLIMSEQIFLSNPYLTRDMLLDKLHRVFDFQKLIITPKLDFEETGHIDLLVKLADAQTVLVTCPAGWLNRGNLRATQALFRRETNAQGQPYRVIEVPNLPPYLNWGVWPIWRSYTNALTVNGRVLVPAYNVREDDEALITYQRAMPDYHIIPIDSSIGINGGGAVHCMTKEIPNGH